MNKSINIALILLLCVTSIACVKEIREDSMVEPDSEKKETMLTRSGEPVHVYERLPNPYALNVMQGVYSKYGINKRLPPTDLYVRFMPMDSSQLSELMEDYGLVLFDHPLDIKLEEGDVYVDPTLQEGETTWLYTTVKPDFIFPKDISYQILERCYIPEDGEEIVLTKVGPVNVEEEAFLSLGYTLEPETKAAVSSPKGRIRVYDDVKNVYVPVKGVEVRCNNIVKWASAYTNENGEYEFDKKFIFNVQYELCFDNSKGFNIFGNLNPFFKASYYMGWHRKAGYSEDIPKNANASAWEHAMINNAAYDYYDMCVAKRILLPPDNLRIWVFDFESSSSAPMLRRICHLVGYNGDSMWKKFFYNIGYAMANNLMQMLKFLLPDITIGTEDKNSQGIYDHVSHELSHASHFSKVGSQFWAKYISYILTYGAYGDGTGVNAELCGIGEMWGYTMGGLLVERHYGEPAFVGIESEWIPAGIFKGLIDEGTLNETEIYACLNNDVMTYNSLVKTMYKKYPDKADDIETVFHSYNIYPDVEKPGKTVIEDKTISSSQSIVGEVVIIQNVTISNNAKLTINAGSSVIINKPFLISKGAQLEINI